MQTSLKQKKPVPNIETGINLASPTIQLSNSFIEDLKKIFDLEPVLPVETIDWKKNRTGTTAY